MPESEVEGMATWALPLDDYIISVFEWDLGNYAENLLAEQCMNDHGYDWAVPHRDLSSLKPSVVQSASGRKLFNADIAQAYGYHSPEWLPADVVAQEQALSSEVLSEEKQAALDSCIVDDARSALPLPQNYTQLAVDVANEALSAALESADVVAAAGRWSECMKPLGIADLPETPLGMPSDFQVEAWGFYDVGSEAGAEEIDVAVADAACRTESGFDVSLYTAEKSLQEEALAENSDALVAEKAEGDAYVARVDAMLAEIGG